MKRAGERGENKWEQISWDEALTLAVDKIYESMQKYGNYSLMTSTGGGGAYLFGETITMAWALKTPNSFEPGCAQCYIQVRLWRFRPIHRRRCRSGTLQRVEARHEGPGSVGHSAFRLSDR